MADAVITGFIMGSLSAAVVWLGEKVRRLKIGAALPIFLTWYSCLLFSLLLTVVAQRGGFQSQGRQPIFDILFAELLYLTPVLFFLFAVNTLA